MEPFDIETHKNRSEIIEQTVQQVQKDFGMFGLDIVFPENSGMAFFEMFGHVSDYVAVLMENDSRRLAALLYHIDLGEDNIARAIEQHAEWSIADIITELVIHRELKKVLTRNYFKQKGTQA